MSTRHIAAPAFKTSEYFIRPRLQRYGVAFTDNDGRYSVSSSTRIPHTVRGMKDGYGWINGVAPGTATITARYYGATTTASVRVRSAQ